MQVYEHMYISYATMLNLWLQHHLSSLCQVPSFYPLCAIAICKRWDCVWGWVNLKDIKHKLGNLPIKLGLPIGSLPIKLGLPKCLKTCNMFWKHNGHDT